jgi:serine/threonine-protein kinase
LGEYRLTRRLGGAETSEVWLAEHELHCRPCVMKLVHPRVPAADRVRIEKAIRRVAGLTHWNTVEVLDLGQTVNGAFYYVMEYIPGPCLQELGERCQPLAPAHVIHWLRQVCGSLREAHGKELIHGNLNPGNVLVCERGGLHDVVKVLDFGMPPSPPYRAPEQEAPDGVVDPRTDVFAVGAIACFLLSGVPPGDASLPPSRLRSDVPGDLQEVLLRCLRPTPEDRFPTVESLSRALSGCQEGGSWTPSMAAAWWESYAPRIKDAAAM